jgi:hypothetical protein
MQKPFFRAGGLDLDPFYEGTLNISIAPATFTMKDPEFTFPSVEWTDKHPPENFSFSRCRLTFNDKEYAGWVYFPDPATKRAISRTRLSLRWLPRLFRKGYQGGWCQTGAQHG